MTRAISVLHIPLPLSAQPKGNSVLGPLCAFNSPCEVSRETHTHTDPGRQAVATSCRGRLMPPGDHSARPTFQRTPHSFPRPPKRPIPPLPRHARATLFSVSPQKTRSNRKKMAASSSEGLHAGTRVQSRPIPSRNDRRASPGCKLPHLYTNAPLSDSRNDLSNPRSYIINCPFPSAYKHTNSQHGFSPRTLLALLTPADPAPYCAPLCRKPRTAVDNLRLRLPPPLHASLHSARAFAAMATGVTWHFTILTQTTTDR